VLRSTNLTKLDNVIAGGRYHNARDFMNFPKVGPARLHQKNPPAIHHKHITGSSNVLDVVGERDILLHYPYQSFHHAIDLLRGAAIDPDVTAIKITLYRVAPKSRVVNALKNAVRNGKKVTVLLELQARFDEAANIHWTRELEQEGAKVLSGVPGLKVHAKLCLITRKEGKKKVDYALVGTGNYNEITAQIYTDHALLTTDPRITREVRWVFDFLKNNYKTHNYKHLIVSPFATRKQFIKLLQNEIRNAKQGKDAYLYAKLNGLVDRPMIEKLYDASDAGVRVRMLVRGICSLVPGIKGMSENIEILSIVDKYLEHSRLFIFCNGGDEKIFISSGDWMPRNLDHRVEVTAPVYDEAIKDEIRRYMEFQFTDSAKARLIDVEQTNQIRANGGGPRRAQEEIYKWLREEHAK
jgi:polyphosphate kinase